MLFYLVMEKLIFMTNYNNILNLILDKRFAIGLYATPILENKQWLDQAIKNINQNKLIKINKDVDKLYDYSKKLSSIEILKLIHTKKDALIHLSETYSYHQRYYFYNEVINYGYFQNYFVNLVKNKKLDLNSTFKKLSCQYKSEAYVLYLEILDIIPNLDNLSPEGIKLILMKKENKKKIELIANKLYISDYDLAINTILEILNNSKTTCGKKTQNYKLSKDIVNLYSFLIENQKKLYYISNNFVKVYDFLRKIEDIDHISQKATLFNKYLLETNYMGYRLEDKAVYYKNMVFFLNSGKVLEMSSEMSQTLSVILNHKRFEQPAIIVNKNVKLIKKNKIATVKPRSVTPEYYRIFFELTNNCNLNCRYCFNRQVKRQTELKIKDWNYISEYLPENTQLNFFGGEPFIKENAEELFVTVDKLLSQKKIKELRCFTNGTNTKQIVNILSKMKNKIWVLISLDGLENQNDFIRGKGNFAKTIETIKQIKKHTNHIVWVKSLVTKANYNNMIDFVKFINKIGVDYYSLGELQIEGNAKNKEQEMISFDMELKLMNDIKDLKLNLKIKDDNIVDDFMINRCGYGHSLVYIRCDGFISGCTENDKYTHHIFELYPDMTVFKKDPIKFIPDIYKTGMIDKNSPCYSCNFVNLCMGGCLARTNRNNTKCDKFRKQKSEFILKHIVKLYKLG